MRSTRNRPAASVVASGARERSSSRSAEPAWRRAPAIGAPSRSVTTPVTRRRNVPGGSAAPTSATGDGTVRGAAASIPAVSGAGAVAGGALALPPKSRRSRTTQSAPPASRRTTAAPTTSFEVVPMRSAPRPTDTENPPDGAASGARRTAYRRPSPPSRRSSSRRSASIPRRTRDRHVSTGIPRRRAIARGGSPSKNRSSIAVRSASGSPRIASSTALRRARRSADSAAGHRARVGDRALVRGPPRVGPARASDHVAQDAAEPGGRREPGARSPLQREAQGLLRRVVGAVLVGEDRARQPADPLRLARQQRRVERRVERRGHRLTMPGPSRSGQRGPVDPPAPGLRAPRYACRTCADLPLNPSIFVTRRSWRSEATSAWHARR